MTHFTDLEQAAMEVLIWAFRHYDTPYEIPPHMIQAAVSIVLSSTSPV